jgi:hypothetical protein
VWRVKFKVKLRAQVKKVRAMEERLKDQDDV